MLAFDQYAAHSCSSVLPGYQAPSECPATRLIKVANGEAAARQRSNEFPRRKLIACRVGNMRHYQMTDTTLQSRRQWVFLGITSLIGLVLSLVILTD